jgi:hypothetical protein
VGRVTIANPPRGGGGVGTTGPSGAISETPPLGIASTQFPLATVFDPGPLDDDLVSQYFTFPGFTTTYDGEMLVAARHAFDHFSVDGVIRVKRSHAGAFAPPPDIGHVAVTVEGRDCRDPTLYREPGTRTIYLTTALTTVLPVGNRIYRSDDEGDTFEFVTATTQLSAAGSTPIRRDSDGMYRMTAFKLGTYNSSVLMEAPAPEGPWTEQVVIVGDAANSLDEWNYIELAPDPSGPWTLVTLNTVGGARYDGWPTPVLMADGTVGIFVRHAGGRGIRLVRCMDPTPANLLDPNQWSESSIGTALQRPLDYGGEGNLVPYGDFQPIKIAGRFLLGAYYGEVDSSRKRARVYVGAFDMRSLLSQRSFIATSEAPTVAGFTTLPTPDQVRIRLPGGGKVRVSASVTSVNPTADSNFSIDVFHSGARWNGATKTIDNVTPLSGPLRASHVTGEIPAARPVTDRVSDVIDLAPGAELHTFQLAVNGTGRNWSNRQLTVEPV